jgi:hypothetical protein
MNGEHSTPSVVEESLLCENEKFMQLIEYKVQSAELRVHVK